MSAPPRPAATGAADGRGPLRTASLAITAMLAFAANSLLCRQALGHADIDPASFTAIRLGSGALVLWWLVQRMPGGAVMAGNDRAAPRAVDRRHHAGDMRSALCLFTYAAAFSYAYVSLPAATGALLLFASVQVTMIGVAWWRGERPNARQVAGLALAAAGLTGLLLPGLAAPAPGRAVLMILAGGAWGLYSLRGRGGGDPVAVTAGNFRRAALLVLPLLFARALFEPGSGRVDAIGLACALASGTLASGLGYAIWYRVLPALGAPLAASMQLSVPVFTALGGLVLLGEPFTSRLVFAAVAILGGIALVALPRRRA